MIELTEEQREVVYTDDANLVVVAAAGSGKTRVLTERFIKHVTDDGLGPDQILTITFTRRAAANMKQRIVNRLKALGRPDMAQVAETGPIQTIHGFCERVLRENALAAGIDPDFEVLEATEAGLAECVWQAVSVTDPEEECILALLEELAGKREFRKVEDHSLLIKHVSDVISGFRQAGLDPDELEHMYRTPEALQQNWNQQLLFRAPVSVREQLATVPANLSFPASLLEAYRLAKVKKPTYLVPSPDADQRALQLSCGLVQLSCRVWRYWEDRLDRNGEIDFSGLERETLKLVQSSHSVLSRIQGQYLVVLVDESQDLNPTQYNILETLAIATSMKVGDPQQSIYGFRQADPELFVEMAGLGTKRLSVNKRTESAGILRFVDKVFAKAWPDSYVPMSPAEDIIDFEEHTVRTYSGVEYWAHLAEDVHATAEGIQQLLSEGIAPRDIGILTATNSYATKLSRALATRGTESRVIGGAETFYARMEVRDLANALEALANPYDDFALLATLRSPIVGLTLDAIFELGRDKPIWPNLQVVKLTLDADNDNLSGFLDWFGPMCSYGDRIPAWEALSKLLAYSPYYENLAIRRQGLRLVANVRKLLSLACGKAEMSVPEFAQYVRTVQRFLYKESEASLHDDDGDLVTVMTVHKAKGLEWPVVVLPEFMKEKSSSGRKSPLLVDERIPMAVFEPGGQSSYLKFLAETKADRARQESVRLLYVGLTRAVHRLCIGVTVPAKQGALIGPIADAMALKRGETPPGVTLRDLTSR